MTIKEFINEGRKADKQAINRYIIRHKDDFEGHIDKNGREIVFDEVAYELLDKIYPLNEPVLVVDGIPEAEHERIKSQLTAEIVKEKEKTNQALEKLTELQTQLVELKSLENRNQLLIEQKNNLETDLQTKTDELMDAKIEIQRLKNRSLLQRIFNK